MPNERLYTETGKSFLKGFQKVFGRVVYAEPLKVFLETFSVRSYRKPLKGFL